jgi:hypothetical protein
MKPDLPAWILFVVVSGSCAAHLARITVALKHLRSDSLRDPPREQVLLRLDGEVLQYVLSGLQIGAIIVRLDLPALFPKFSYPQISLHRSI